jgi:hypothetical protein
MHTILSMIMLGCCALGILGPVRAGMVRNLSQWGPMAIMLVAMADTTVGPGIFPDVVWALLLLLASPLPLLLLPKDRRSGMEIHRSMSIVAMFAILVTTLPPSSPGPLHQTHEHSGLGGVNPALALALALAVVAYSIILAVRTARQNDGRKHPHHPFEPVEVLSSAGALGAMILMAL